MPPTTNVMKSLMMGPFNDIVDDGRCGLLVLHHRLTFAALPTTQGFPEMLFLTFS